MKGKTKIYAGILAGGIGSRMGATVMPKQFLPIGGKPVILHTVEKFLLNKSFDGIYIAVVKSYLAHTKALLEKELGPLAAKVCVIEGGSDRSESICNVIKEIRRSDKSADSILVTHDAVRPFVSARIIEENIDLAIESGATDTVIPATDTIIRSLDGESICNVPTRSELFCGQTPQSFKISWFEEDFSRMSAEQKARMTDACGVFTASGRVVRLVIGDPYNMKISTPFDLKLAEAIVSTGAAEGSK